MLVVILLVARSKGKRAHDRGTTDNTDTGVAMCQRANGRFYATGNAVNNCVSRCTTTTFSLEQADSDFTVMTCCTCAGVGGSRDAGLLGHSIVHFCFFETPRQTVISLLLIMGIDLLACSVSSLESVAVPILGRPNTKTVRKRLRYYSVRPHETKLAIYHMMEVMLPLTPMAHRSTALS